MTNFLPNLLIGLREGLEASLIVSILVAYLVKTNRRDGLKPVALGVAIAVAVSLAVGGILQYSTRTLTFEAQEILGGTLSIIAVAFVTYMVFWMRRAARAMKADLEGKAAHALELGTAALMLTSLLAVGREGLETAFFVWSTVQAAGGSSVGPMIGAFAGIAVAVVLAYGLYRGAVRINLAKFFKYTGAMLIVVAAGVLSYGFHDLQEAALLPGINALAFDLSSWYSATSWYGTVLKGVFNFGPQMTVLEVTVWLAYFVPVMALFLRRPKSTTPVASSDPVRQPVSVG